MNITKERPVKMKEYPYNTRNVFVFGDVRSCVTDTWRTETDL